MVELGTGRAQPLDFILLYPFLFSYLAAHRSQCLDLGATLGD